jgi:hypothetical protein
LRPIHQTLALDVGKSCASGLVIWTESSVREKMATLNDLLRGLGVESTPLVPTGQEPVDQPWTTGKAFVPVIGAVYEVDFGIINYQGRQVNATARLRIDGASPADWFDLDDGKPLSEELRGWSVKRFRTAETG